MPAAEVLKQNPKNINESILFKLNQFATYTMNACPFALQNQEGNGFAT